MFVYVILILLPTLALSNDPLDVIDVLEVNLFNELDTNTDGVISKPELQGYFLNYDVNKDGDLTLPELSSALANINPDLIGEETGLFALYDHEKNGKIDAVDIDAFLDLFNFNDDSLVKSDEFHIFITNGLRQ